MSATPDSHPAPQWGSRPLLRVSGRFGYTRNPGHGGLSPRRYAVNLNFQGEAQQCAHENEYSKDQHAVEGDLDGDGANDVGCNKNLEPEQEGAAKVFSHTAIHVKTETMVAKCLIDRPEGSHNKNGNPDELEGIGDQFESSCPLHGCTSLGAQSLLHPDRYRRWSFSH